MIKELRKSLGLTQSEAAAITHIPLRTYKNYENVRKSIEVMLDRQMFSLSKRHITISTSGVLPGIKKMLEDNLDVMLAVSLHAPNQELRKELIPTI